MRAVAIKRIVVLLAASVSFICQGQVLMEYFYQVGCEECNKVNALVLPRVVEQYGDHVRIDRYDIGIPENYIRLAGYQEKFSIDSNDSVCIVLNGVKYLGGYNQIEEHLIPELKLRIQAREQVEVQEASDSRVVKSRAEKFTVGAIVLAGLVDGINPCVFATLIFFISLLSVSGIKGKTLLAVGSVYCFACFISYLALGFGLFRFIKLLSGYSEIRRLIEGCLILVLGVFAFLSFRDAWKYRKTGKAGDVSLQLPDKMKRKIHQIMKKGLRYKYLLPGAFGIGVLVTALESVCTGQVYIPTLVLLSRESGYASQWFAYLLLYNLMFILPLLVVFGISWYGTRVSDLLMYSRKNVIWGKIALGVFFLILAFIMILLI